MENFHSGIWHLKWAPPSDRGVEFLVGGATQSAGSGIRVNIEQ